MTVDRVALEAAREAVRRATESFTPREIPSSLYTAPALHAKPEKRTPLAARDPHLESTLRAEARREYEAALLQRMEEKQRQAELERRVKEEKENREIQARRRIPISEGGLMFTAKSPLKTDPYPAKYVSPRKLTEPESPHLLINKRMGAKRNGNM